MEVANSGAGGVFLLADEVRDGEVDCIDSHDLEEVAGQHIPGAGNQLFDWSYHGLPSCLFFGRTLKLLVDF